MLSILKKITDETRGLTLQCWYIERAFTAGDATAAKGREWYHVEKYSFLHIERVIMVNILKY